MRAIRHLSAFAMLMLGSFLAVAAQAAPITVTFSGTVTSAGTALPPTIVVGSAINGSYTYDSNAANTSANPAATGDYPVTAFTETVGGFSFSSSTATLFVELSSGEYSVSGIGGAGDTVNGHKLDVFGLTSAFSSLSSTASPLTLPNNPFVITLLFGLPPGEGDVSGTLSEITLTTVPEPGSLLLMLTAIAGLVGAGVGRLSPMRIIAHLRQRNPSPLPVASHAIASPAST